MSSLQKQQPKNDNIKKISSETDFDYKAMMCSKIITYVAQEPSFTGDINSLVANVCSSIAIGKRNAPASKITADSQRVGNGDFSPPFKLRRFQKQEASESDSGDDSTNTDSSRSGQESDFSEKNHLNEQDGGELEGEPKETLHPKLDLQNSNDDWPDLSESSNIFGEHAEQGLDDVSEARSYQTKASSIENYEESQSVKDQIDDDGDRKPQSVVYRRLKDDSIANEPADPFERAGLKAEDLSILTRGHLSKSGNFKASLVTSIVTTRLPDNWKNLPVIAIGQHHRYGYGWTNLLNKVVAVYNPYCTYAYKRNHIKKINSRKKNFPYFKGTAVCSRGECNCQLTAEIDTETSDFFTYYLFW